MSTNRYPAGCARCKEIVPAEEGSLTKVYSGWEVRHLEDCLDVEALSVGRIVTDYAPRWGNDEVFEHEKFGVVFAMAVVKLPNYDDNAYMDKWQTFARAATAEELKAFNSRKAESAARNEKLKTVKVLMDGRVPCNCWHDAGLCKAPHLDKNRDSERLTLVRGDMYNKAIYANIPADRTLPIVIHSFHSENCDAVAFKEIEYTDAVAELLRWKATDR